MTGLPAETINAHRVGFDRLYGLEVLECGETEARARVKVRPEVLQPYGLVHGGLYAAIAESLTSMATALALASSGRGAVGMSNATSFLRPITEGFVHAHARRLHAGRTTWIWDVECRDDAGRTCAITRMTIAVRSAEQLPPGGQGAGAVGEA
ncbi:MAG: PaaI family thioesterase, partial [Solirubrobacteraceae bacterium]